MNFTHKTFIEEFNFFIERGLDKNQVQRPDKFSFIKKHKDQFIAGSIGTYKTYLATALGQEAFQREYRVINIIRPGRSS